MKNEKYIVGIDLGTTNCTMAYAPIENPNQAICQFSIPQITLAGVQEDHFSLPSFVYFPLSQELSAKAAAIDWDSKRCHCIGIFARERGSELSSRLISSAKSWLCHTGINRREKAFPLGDHDDNIQKMSPLDACAEFLQHLKEAWENKMPGSSFTEQQIFITVPASFDPSARQLVQEAAALAGYPEVVLLEEPQAAFYSWLYDHSEAWRNLLKIGDTILVIDIGGGTTDFSLISVESEGGDLSLKRIAVGSHLLLGGDNVDHALAYFAKNKFEEEGHLLDEWQFQSLIHACRNAKEALMGENPPAQTAITLMGRGSKLIGNSINTTITFNEVTKIIVDGFIPVVKPEEKSKQEKRVGLQQLGLPYVQDARISCQLAKFLSMTGESEGDSLSNFIVPSAVLFNGGTMKSAVMRNRLVEILNKWAKQLGKPSVKVLENQSYDYAVSRGAVYYGLARTGKAIRIKSGTSRSYFVGVQEAVPAVPGIAPPIKAVCIVPYGMEEGTEQVLNHQEFALSLGDLATFRFFSHAVPAFSNGETPCVGTVIKNWKSELTELLPIETVLERGEEEAKMVQVQLKSKITELGMLELWCEAQNGRKWKLEFDIRGVDAKQR